MTHRNMYSMTLKGQGQNLTSGQGHVVTQVGHIAYESKRLDQRNTMGPLTHVSISSESKVIRKKRLVNLGDLR